MNCEKFQEVLPYIIESGGNADEEAHLRTCPYCAELVQDLTYIATQAKLLLPMYDPSPRVWTGIEQALHHRGFIQEGRTSLRGHMIAFPTQAKGWTPFGWAIAAAALIAFSVILVNYRPHLLQTQPLAQNINAAQPAVLAGEDQKLIARVSQQAPDVQRAYEDSLREVNTYITDAQQAVEQDPQDEVAREQLLDAYEQKQMLYEMATDRTLPSR